MAKVFQKDTDGTLLTSLLAYFKLEDANDFWAAFNLTNTGGVSFAAGKVNNAANYGVALDRHLSIADSLGIDGGAMSFSCWIKVAEAPANGTNINIAAQSNAASKTVYDLYYTNAAGVYKLEFVRARQGVAAVINTFTVTLDIDTWYHVVGSYDGTNIKLYLNNDLKDSDAASGSGTVSPGNNFDIGANRVEGSIWKGMIDEVGVWAKALSAQEIADLYNSGNGQTMIEAVVGNRFFQMF